MSDANADVDPMEIKIGIGTLNHGIKKSSQQLI